MPWKDYNKTKKYQKVYITKKYTELRYKAMKIIDPNLKCSCCEFPIWEFFHIDHTDPKTKNGKKTYRMYNDIISGQDPPEMYQLLCMRCNLNKDRKSKCELDHFKDSWKERMA